MNIDDHNFGQYRYRCEGDIIVKLSKLSRREMLDQKELNHITLILHHLGLISFNHITVYSLKELNDGIQSRHLLEFLTFLLFAGSLAGFAIALNANLIGSYLGSIMILGYAICMIIDYKRRFGESVRELINIYATRSDASRTKQI